MAALRRWQEVVTHLPVAELPLVGAGGEPVDFALRDARSGRLFAAVSSPLPSCPVRIDLRRQLYSCRYKGVSDLASSAISPFWMEEEYLAIALTRRIELTIRNFLPFDAAPDGGTA